MFCDVCSVHNRYCTVRLTVTRRIVFCIVLYCIVLCYAVLNCAHILYNVICCKQVSKELNKSMFLVSEMLYEDENFNSRELAALVASKVCMMNNILIN